MDHVIGNIKWSGQITVTTAGTAVQGDDVDCPNGVIVRALAANTGVMYIGNDGAGDVSSSTGFQLDASEKTYIPISNLKDMWVDSAVNGEKVCWALA